MNLVIEELRRTNPSLLPGGADMADSHRNAHVPARNKRDLLGHIYRQGGAEVLLNIGQGVKRYTDAPLIEMYLRSSNPSVFLDKWRRLERFGHSHNRSRIEALGSNGASFHRFSKEDPPPSAPENLLICGFLIALLETLGCRGIRCSMPLAGGGEHLIYDAHNFDADNIDGELLTDSWEFHWESYTARHVDIATPPRSEIGAIAFSQVGNPGARAVLQKATQILGADPGRQWSVDELACACAHSTRSLQRKLREAGLGFSSLVRAIRIGEACRLLNTDEASITTIGYCCGFSDSAHFSRDFKRSTGFAPRDFRAESASGSALNSV